VDDMQTKKEDFGSCTNKRNYPKNEKFNAGEVYSHDDMLNININNSKCFCSKNSIKSSLNLDKSQVNDSVDNTENMQNRINTCEQKIEELINVKAEKFQKSRVFMLNKIALRDHNIEDFCRIVVSYIKDKIGIDHNNFDKYFKILKERKFNALEDVLSETTILNFMKIGNIDTCDKRNLSKAKKFCQVIALALLNCSNYKSLYNKFKSVSGLKDRQTRDLIKKYIPLLNSINPKLDVKIWMPKKVHAPYTYSQIKSYIQNKNWVLLRPENQNEFNYLKKNIKNSDIPLLVHCKNPEHLEWRTSFRSILNNNSNCPDCSNNVCTYNQIKQMVKILGSKMSDYGGILVYPESNEKFLQIRRDKGKQPSYITIIVSCKNHRHKSWKTNAVNLSQGKWCRECYIEKNTKYDFDAIKNLVGSKGGTLIYPKNQEEYEKLFNQLKNIKLKHNSPSDLPIKVF
jgi:hypothetical protein